MSISITRRRLATPAAAARRRDLLLDLSDGISTAEAIGSTTEDDDARAFLVSELPSLLAHAAAEIERLEELVHR